MKKSIILAMGILVAVGMTGCGNSDKKSESSVDKVSISENTEDKDTKTTSENSEDKDSKTTTENTEDKDSKTTTENSEDNDATTEKEAVPYYETEAGKQMEEHIKGYSGDIRAKNDDERSWIVIGSSNKEIWGDDQLFYKEDGNHEIVGKTAIYIVNEEAKTYAVIDSGYDDNYNGVEFDGRTMAYAAECGTYKIYFVTQDKLYEGPEFTLTEFSDDQYDVKYVLDIAEEFGLK